MIGKWPLHILSCLAVLLFAGAGIKAQTRMVFVEYNCENLFDCRHDSLKNDSDFLPEGRNQWTPKRYRTKTNDIARVIQQCGEGGNADGSYHLPDLAVLCEVENDSTLLALTRRSLLRGAGYKYVMTQSDDLRGIDVALLYNPLTFRLLSSQSIRIKRPHGARPTRDILYVKGLSRSEDTLHIFALHAPSRRGGAEATEHYRLLTVKQLLSAVDSIRTHDNKEAAIIIAGDFNDYSGNASLKQLCDNGFIEASYEAKGKRHSHTGAEGTYKYQGWWNSLDHIFLSQSLSGKQSSCFILDNQWMLEEDPTWGGYKPKRTYTGNYYHKGVSDHLPIVLHLTLN